MQEFLSHPQQDGLLTLAEASAIMGVSKITLRRWTTGGLFPCVRIGSRNDRRFRPVDIQEFILTHLGKPAAPLTSPDEAKTGSPK